MKRGPSALSLKGRALQLLAQREHSRAELRRKLLPYAALCGASARGTLEGPVIEDGASSGAALPAPSHRRREAAGSATIADRSGIGRLPPVSPDQDIFDPVSDVGPAPSGELGEADEDGDIATTLPRPHAQPVFERSTERRGGASPADAACVDALLDWLEAQGHLSDERFVESRVHVRAPRFGMQRIRQELARHGAQLSPDDMQVLKASEAERARQVWTRKFGEPAIDAAGRARQMRFLAARGFDAEVVRRIVPAVRPGGFSTDADDDPVPDSGAGA